MEKIIKYNRIYRICPKRMKGIPKYLLEKVADPQKKKKCLTDAEVYTLLDGNTIIEEKIDGGVVGIAWNGEKHLAIGKHSMIPPDTNTKKFYGLNNWIYQNYEKIQKIPLGWVIYGEWMRASHKIFYNRLEDYFVAFDIWDGYRYLDLQSRSDFLRRLGFAEVPFIYGGTNINVSDILRMVEGLSMSNRSRFSDTETIEGFVIKNYDKQLYGKYVRREFLNFIEENWLGLPLIENLLRSYHK